VLSGNHNKDIRNYVLYPSMGLFSNRIGRKGLAKENRAESECNRKHV
jgi:hypothetical protein